MSQERSPLNFRQRLMGPVRATIASAALFGGAAGACGGGEGGTGAKVQKVLDPLPTATLSGDNISARGAAVTETPFRVTVEPKSPATSTTRSADTGKPVDVDTPTTAVPATATPRPPTATPAPTEAPKPAIPAEAQKILDGIDALPSVNDQVMGNIRALFNENWAGADTDRKKWAAYRNIHATLGAVYNQQIDKGSSAAMSIKAEMKKIEDYCRDAWPDFSNQIAW